MFLFFAYLVQNHHNKNVKYIAERNLIKVIG